MSRPNWFVGFPISGAGWLERAQRGAPSGLATFAAEDLHATVAFLGPVTEASAHAAWTMAKHAARDVVPLTGTLDRLAPMGPPGAWSALSALFGEGHAALAQVIGTLRDPISDAAGARREVREPKPHVTIARPTRRASGAERKAALEWAAEVELGAPRVVVDRLALFTWSEDRTTRRFRIVEEIALVRASV